MCLPQGCNTGYPCEINVAYCATGMAGGLTSPSHNWICMRDVPLSSKPNGAGA